MAKPYFPIDFSQVAAKRDFHQIESGGVVETGGLTVRPFPLNHPQGASGYRIECNGVGDRLCNRLRAWRARIGRHRSANTRRTPTSSSATRNIRPPNTKRHRGWGHSTWENAVLLARDARAEHLMLFHHDPVHDDQTMMRISQDARIQFENTTAAWEGFVAAL